MKRICWLLILTVSPIIESSSSPETSGQLLFENLVLSPAVSDNLALLFEQFDTELVLCLEGERRGPDLYVTDFRMPHIIVSETGRVQAAGCDVRRGSVGTWHNHPAPASGITRASSHLLARNCYLSRTDVADFRRRTDALVSVVSCGPRTFAYWKRGDLKAAPEDAAVLPPPEGQLLRYEIAEDDRASALTQARER